MCIKLGEINISVFSHQLLSLLYVSSFDKTRASSQILLIRVTLNMRKDSNFCMDSKASFSSNFHILNVSIARRVFFRAIFFASAISIVSLLRFLPTLDLASLAPKTYVDCVADSQQSRSQNTALEPGSYLFQSRVLNTFWGSFDSLNCMKHANLTFSVVTELMGKRFLNHGARSLCIGEGSPMAVSAMQQLGFTSVSGVHKNSLFSLKQKRIVCELEYQVLLFGLVFSEFKRIYNLKLFGLVFSEFKTVYNLKFPRKLWK